MKPIKINISPEVREFNEAVEQADVLTDYQHDRESADVLTARLESLHLYPCCVKWLKEATEKAEWLKAEQDKMAKSIIDKILSEEKL